MSSEEKCPKCSRPLPKGSPEGLCPRCLLAATAATGDEKTQFPAFEELAELFPKLEILEMIGHGGFGIVYKVRQPNLDRYAALKLIRPTLSDKPGFAERFKREAQALTELKHPNIVDVYDFDERDGMWYLLMEYVEGSSLRELMSAEELPARRLEIVTQVCDALQFAHDKGVVHRDIKPENILVGDDGKVKIVDFGLIKYAMDDPTQLTVTGTTMGTPYYMAPEQLTNPSKVDHRADIYSLGVVIYELLTGELPVGRWDPPSHKAAVDVHLDEVVLRSLEKEPERRYQHVSDVKDAVNEAKESQSHAAQTETPRGEATRQVSSSPGAMIAGGIIMGLSILLGVPTLVIGLLMKPYPVGGPAPPPIGPVGWIVITLFAGGLLLGFLLFRRGSKKKTVTGPAKQSSSGSTVVVIILIVLAVLLGAPCLLGLLAIPFLTLSKGKAREMELDAYAGQPIEVTHESMSKKDASMREFDQARDALEKDLDALAAEYAEKWKAEAKGLTGTVGASRVAWDKEQEKARSDLLSYTQKLDFDSAAKILTEHQTMKPKWPAVGLRAGKRDQEVLEKLKDLHKKHMVPLDGAGVVEDLKRDYEVARLVDQFQIAFNAKGGGPASKKVLDRASGEHKILQERQAWYESHKKALALAKKYNDLAPAEREKLKGDVLREGRALFEFYVRAMSEKTQSRLEAEAGASASCKFALKELMALPALQETTEIPVHVESVEIVVKPGKYQLQGKAVTMADIEKRLTGEDIDATTTVVLKVDARVKEKELTELLDLCAKLKLVRLSVVRMPKENK